MSNATQKHLDSIVGRLVRYRYYKGELETVKLELRKAAFECGLPQEDIPKININDFLDGYLVANGMIQSYRLEK
jgi:hypothetical protein